MRHFKKRKLWLSCSFFKILNSLIHSSILSISVYLHPFFPSFFIFLLIFLLYSLVHNHSYLKFNFMDLFLLFSRLVMSDSLQPHGLQYGRLPCPSLPPGVCSQLTSIVLMMPSNHLILCLTFLLLPSIFLSIKFFSSVSALLIRSAKVSELQLQHQSFQ